VFDRFTDSARRAIVSAQEQAHDLGHDYVGTEHLLLGLLVETEGVGARALAWLNVSAEAARRRVEEVIGRGTHTRVGVALPFTPRSKRVLERSSKEARNLGDAQIGTEHLLLALMAERDGVGAQVLDYLGVTSDQVRAVVRATVLRREAPIRPNVRARPMTSQEFEGHAATSIDHHARELERNGRASRDVAKDRAEQGFASLLPDGMATAGHVFLVGEDAETGEHIGVLWFGPSTDDRSVAWLYDVTVDEEVRGRGYGRALMLRFEDEARARGFSRAGLNVFGDNAVARRLYESLGYREAARQLYKDLPATEA
jgi:ribosomal protein S18 acetylase RimI-like enzyme